MTKPRITRPKFPKGYVDNPVSEVPWEHVEKRLSESMNYWLCSVYPDGRPPACSAALGCIPGRQTLL
jgi:hypothetical protein